MEIAPTAQPPVRRLMDYGKFKYSEKKAHEAKLKQKIILVKEVKYSVRGTDDGDYNIKHQAA